MDTGRLAKNQPTNERHVMKWNLHCWKPAMAAVCAAAILTPAALLAGGPPKARHENGTIKSVDANAHTLVIAGLKGHSEHKFQWNGETKFMEHGKTLTAGDLKEGMKASITYRSGGDTPTMQTVRLAPAKT